MLEVPAPSISSLYGQGSPKVFLTHLSCVSAISSTKMIDFVHLINPEKENNSHFKTAAMACSDQDKTDLLD